MVTIRDEIIEFLDAVDRIENDRVRIVRVIVDEKGNQIGRLYRGSFISPDSIIGEPQQEDR
jgi:hypothetical protein